MITPRPKRLYTDTLAYEPTTARERAIAGGIVLALLAGVVAVVPFAHVRTPPVAAFVATIETLVITTALFTASLLYAEFRMRRHAPLAILATAYALLAALHGMALLTFPGTFAPDGLFGAGPQTSGWLGTLGGFGFTAVAVAYAYVERFGPSPRWRAGAAARICVAAAGYVALVVLVATCGESVLPVVVASGGAFGPLAVLGLLPALIVLALGATVLVFRWCGATRRAHLWLAVVLLVTTLQLLAAVLGGGRFTLGWCVGQAYLAIGSMMLFCVMQTLLSSILRRAAHNGERAQALAEIVTLGSDTAVDRNSAMLARAAHDLRFDWAFLARIDGEWMSLDTCVGGPYAANYEAPLAGAWVREVLSRSDLAVFGPDELPWIDVVTPAEVPWASAVGVPIYVNDTLYGFAGFASQRRRDGPLLDADRTFLTLVGALAGATIQRWRQQRRLDELAFTDALTSLPNRVLLHDRLKQMIADAERYHRAFAVHFLDLDGFKEINDTFGHAAGDAVLVEVARRLRFAVRDSDTVSRLGGDEFVVVQSQLEDPKDADRLAARLRSTFEAPISFGSESLAIGTSIGTSRFPHNGRDIHSLLVRADQELYRSKERRRRAAAAAEVAFLHRDGAEG